MLTISLRICKPHLLLPDIALPAHASLSGRRQVVYNADVASVPADITRVLESASQGDAAAKSQLFDAVYDELRSMAAALLAHERPDAKVTIQPTSLVHEAYLKLIRNAEPAWQSRAHFFGAAARAMRQILIDRARHLKAIRGRAAELHEDTGLPTLDSDRKSVV